MISELLIPKTALVLLLAPSGAGKSTFAKAHFPPSAIVSSDQCRYYVSDDSMNQECTPLAFRLFDTFLQTRLEFNRLAIADATNLGAQRRKDYIALAKANHAPTVLIDFEVSLEDCLAQNRLRASRGGNFVPEHVIKNHHIAYGRAMSEVLHEGYDYGYGVIPHFQYKITYV
jgi:protein phosphatase